MVVGRRFSFYRLKEVDEEEKKRKIKKKIRRMYL